MRGSKYDQKTKLKVVALYLSGASVPGIAAALELPERTVRDWVTVENFAEVRRKRSDTLDAFLCAYLEATMKALTAIAAYTAREDWLQKQSAGKLAVLVDALTESALRMLTFYYAIKERKPHEAR